ncbi:hypothetical protein IJJ18_02175 [Candidatus Saccharibacteria bacterium]|nr:hypothetical protein [Candidatus Saccharibacteria bacterium]
MTKQQAPAPKPKKVTRNLPSRGKYIDFIPQNAKPAMSRPKKPAKKLAEVDQPVRPVKPVKPARPTEPDKPLSVRVSRTTVISTTKQKAPEKEYLPPAKEEDFDEDLLSELDFEEEGAPIFTKDELAALDSAFSPEEEAPEETPEDFMSEKSVDEYASALTALKVTSVDESPFISSVSVDKRPLSEGRRLVEEDDNAVPADIREENFHSPVRNVYTRRHTPEKTGETYDPLSRSQAPRRHSNVEDIEPNLKSLKSRELREKEAKISGHDTRIVSPRDGHSGPFALVIAIILMVIFGGVFGAVIYLAFFQ